jgi:hypothetical protein
MNLKESSSKKPCLGCPFRRHNTNEKPNPGGSHPMVYLGQIHGPFWLPCHQDKNYDGKGSDIETVSQCRGAAVFRSNCETINTLPKQLLSLPEDRSLVFSNESEFVQHYLEVDSTMAEILTERSELEKYTTEELTKISETRRYHV